MSSHQTKFLSLIALLGTFFSSPLPAPAQTVSEKFGKLAVSENFDSISTYWTTIANSENLFIVQDGEYILQRKSTNAPYAIIAGFEEPFSDFRVVTSIKIDKSLSEDAFAGFMFMLQPSGTGGFLVEINKRKEYRLRQIVEGSYRYLTGNAREGGWVRNQALMEPNLSNMVEIRVMDRHYDLFLNNTFVQSFTEPSYKSGNMGLLIGPASRAKVDFIYVFTRAEPEETAEAAESTSQGSEAVQGGPDIIELAESIIRLKTQINSLNEENEELHKTISAMKSGDAEHDVTLRNYEKQVKTLQDESTHQQKTVDSLKKANTELEKFKEMAGGNENGDLVITLSKTLKAEKEKTAQLEAELKALREEYNVPVKPDTAKGSKSTKPKSSNQGEVPKNNNTFSLPNDH